MRIFYPDKLALGEELVLDANACRHLQVLRVQLKDRIVLFNGLGGEYEAEITHVSKKSYSATPLQHHSIELESPLDITIAQGIAKGDKMDFIVQKAVELGANSIQPLITSRGNVRYADNEREQKRVNHWQQIVISACEQSGRNHIPIVLPPLRLAAWLGQAAGQFNVKIVLDPYAQQTLKSITLPTIAKICLLLGPEGGLSREEIKEASQANFIAVKLGPRVLRTETATLAALTALQALWGDLIPE